MTEQHKFDHIKLATMLREVVRLRQLGEHTWRAALMDLRQKSYFNARSFHALAVSDYRPILFNCFVVVPEAVEFRDTLAES